MRIDGLNDNRISVEKISLNDNQVISETTLGEAVKLDNKTVTMKSTDISKSGVLGVGNNTESFDDIKEKAEMLKNNFEVMKDKMETGQTVDMNAEELDVNNSEVEEIVTVFERVQIKLAMYCDDYTAEGTGINLNEIKATMGNTVATYKAASAMSDSAKDYLVKNELEPTVENVYKAIHSGTNNSIAKPLSEVEWNEIRPQAKKIINEAGLEISDATLLRSRYMVENEIALTKENIQYYEVLDELKVPSDEEIIQRIAGTVIEGRDVKQTKVTGESLPFEEAAMAIQVLQMATEGHIMALSKEDVKNLDVLSDIENKNITYTPDSTDLKYLTTYRQIQEIRLMMTIDAGRVIENSGVSINTTELSDLIDQLRNYEVAELTKSVDSNTNNVEIVEVNTINDILIAMEDLKKVPAAVLGFAIEESTVSPQALINKAYKNASESYEALSTEIRVDLGDSLFKAVKSSTDDILAGLSYEDNEANRRAVRILAYNEMEMTASNIDKIKDLDIAVNTLFKKMTPEKTLKMIREGVAPLTKDVRELTDYLNQIPTEKQVEKYSEFLYKLEKNNEITADEREKYMAVYSLINKFEKDGMNAVGSLYEQGLDFTMGNLITAYMTRKSGGIDVKADINTGLAEIKDKVSYYKHLFANVREKTMPEVLSEMDDYENMSPEKFVNEIEKSNSFLDNSLAYENLKKAVNSDSQVIKFLAEYDIPSTPNNILEVQKLFKSPVKIFDNNKEYKLYEKMLDKSELTEEFEKLTNDAKTELVTAFDTKETFLDVNSLKQINTGMNVLNSLARKNNFYIPYSRDGKEMVINLKIVEETNESGKFQITFENDEYGKVSVEGKINGANLFAQIISDDTDSVKNINEKIAPISAVLEKEGFEKVNIIANKSDERPSLHSVVKEDVSTAKLFSTAKIFVDYLTN